MSTIKVDTIQTRTGSGNITVSNPFSGNNIVSDANIATGISASKLTGALPALDGSALTGAGSMIKLAHTTVAVGSADNYPFNFTSVFSSTYNNYFFTFTIATAANAAGLHFFFHF